MTTDEKATAACRAAMAQTNALAWRSARPFCSKAELLSHALALASLGLKPVPMRSQDKRPARKGWREAASLDLDTITSAFNTAPPYADALGVATGGGVFVIDLDRNHKDGADGVAAFAAMIARHGEGGALVRGPRVSTPSGGLHVYFRSPPGRRVRTRTAIAPGVDVRGEGGVAIVPPSARDGIAYRWTRPPWECALPQAPAWLLDLVAPFFEASREAAASVRPYRGAASTYARVAFERELKAVASAAPGTRNDALNRAAFALGSLCAAGALPVDAVAKALLEAAEHNGLTAEDGEAAARATIASGLRAGRAKPRQLPPPKRWGHFSKGQKREARK